MAPILFLLDRVHLHVYSPDTENIKQVSPHVNYIFMAMKTIVKGGGFSRSTKVPSMWCLISEEITERRNLTLALSARILQMTDQFFLAALQTLSLLKLWIVEKDDVFSQGEWIKRTAFHSKFCFQSWWSLHICLIFIYPHAVSTQKTWVNSSEEPNYPQAARDMKFGNRTPCEFLLRYCL